MDKLKYFKGKKILITGGTGSVGHQIMKELIRLKPEKIIIFSRDEEKQFRMQKEFADSPLLEFVIGDIRDYSKIYEALKGIDVVYHAAALKHVPLCEFNPMEAVKTNILGADNIRRAAIERKVNTVVIISTDKAVKAVNIMGMTKAIQERILLNSNGMSSNTKFVGVRYGNIIGSRSSVIPIFKQLIEAGKAIEVTNYNMTRFMMTLEQAIELIFKVTVEGKNGQIFVKKIPACRIETLAQAVGLLLTGKNNYPVDEVGIRPGEKMHEILVSEEEMNRVKEGKDFFIIEPVGRSNKRKQKKIEVPREYASNSERLLSEKEMICLLKREKWA